MLFPLFLLSCALIIVGLLLATGIRIGGPLDLWPPKMDEQRGRAPRPRPTTKQLIAGGLCFIVGLGGLAYIRHAATNDVIDRSTVSCPQYASTDNHCVPELEKTLGVNTEDVIQEAERNITVLTDEQTRAFTDLACTTPTRELHLTASRSVNWNPTPADIWRNYTTSTTKNNTRYVALPEDYSPENFQASTNGYYAGMYDYTAQWAAPGGGWIANESHTSWDDLLKKNITTRAETRTLTVTDGLTQTITCPEN